jgi:hypothetical protein
MYTSRQVHLPGVLFRSMKGWSGAMVDWLGQVLLYRDSKLVLPATKQRKLWDGNDHVAGCGLGNLKVRPGLFISRSRRQANLNLK